MGRPLPCSLLDCELEEVPERVNRQQLTGHNPKQMSQMQQQQQQQQQQPQHQAHPCQKRQSHQSHVGFHESQAQFQTSPPHAPLSSSPAAAAITLHLPALSPREPQRGSRRSLRGRQSMGASTSLPVQPHEVLIHEACRTFSASSASPHGAQPLQQQPTSPRSKKERRLVTESKEVYSDLPRLASIDSFIEPSQARLQVLPRFSLQADFGPPFQMAEYGSPNLFLSSRRR